MLHHKKIKKAPLWLKHGYLVIMYQSVPFVILSNWLTQGIFGMQWVERFFKLLLEITGIIVGIVIWKYFIGTITPLSLTVIIFWVHTFNWLFNGHFFVLGRYIGLTSTAPEKFINYPLGLNNRLKRFNSIGAVLIFGSLSRNNFSMQSDLDVRIIAGEHIADQVMACALACVERTIALFLRYPLDIYVVTVRSGLEKLREDEVPIVLFEQGSVLEGVYNQKWQFAEIRKHFLEVMETAGQTND